MLIVQVCGDDSRQLPDVAPRHGGQDRPALPVLAPLTGRVEHFHWSRSVRYSPLIGPDLSDTLLSLVEP